MTGSTGPGASAASSPADGVARTLLVAYRAVGRVGVAEAWQRAQSASPPATAGERAYESLFGGGPVDPRIAERAREALARAYLDEVGSVSDEQRADYVDAVARDAALGAGLTPLCLLEALQSVGATARSTELADAAAALAVADGGGIEGSAYEILEQLWDAGAAQRSPPLEGPALAAFALQVSAGRERRLIALVEGASSIRLLGYLVGVLALDSGTEGTLQLLKRESPTARAAAVRALARSGRFRSEPGAIADAETAVLISAEMRRASRELSEVADRADARGAPAALAGAVRRVLAPREVKIELLYGIGVVSDEPTPFFEACLSESLQSLEIGESMPPPTEAAAAAAVCALVRAGHGTEVAAQLLGAGLEVDREGRSLHGWAELNLRIARMVATDRPQDASLFYVNLVSLVARSTGRIEQFGAAAPLLAPVRTRLHLAGGGTETHARGGRERYFHTLAEEIQAQDAETSVEAVARSPVEQFAVVAQDVDGVRVNPPGRVSDLVRVVTGFEFFRRLFTVPLRWLGLRRSGRLEVRPDALAIEQTSRFLGQQIRSSRQEISPATIGEVRRTERSPVAFLVLGLVLLVVLTWLGVSVAYDGFSIKDGLLIGAGLGCVALGLLLDGVLYALFRSVRHSTVLVLGLTDRARPVRLSVPRQEADRVLAALRALRGSSRHRLAQQPKSERTSKR